MPILETVYETNLGVPVTLGKHQYARSLHSTASVSRPTMHNIYIFENYRTNDVNMLEPYKISEFIPVVIIL